MIKKLFTIGLALAAVGASAQQVSLKTRTLTKTTTVQMDASNRWGQPASTYSVTIDTLSPASVLTGGCSASYSNIANYQAYSTADSGRAFGAAIPQTFTATLSGATHTVVASTVMLAQKYSVGSAAATVTDVLALAGTGHGTATTTTAKIFALNAGTGSPAASPLGTSAAVPMSVYQTAAMGASVHSRLVGYHFATPVSLAANAMFFAAVSVPAFGTTDMDSMSVLTTAGGCSANAADSLAWMQTSYAISGVPAPQIQWASVKRLFGAANALDIMLFPVIDITTLGINDYVKLGALSLYAAYPNPANSAININFSVENASAVEIQVYDITGKIVKTINDNAVSGKNLIAVDVTSLNAGSYMYSINAGGAKMFSKFVVIK
ncbi:MAG: T9SS type A sorting domain-containing protein [Bacteroidetes bacterium]|nr:T9SS type A sorting domain-containing protein [Bacteroidota bacterium]